MREFKLLINGKLLSGAARLNVINPATEEVLAEAPRADRAQLDEAIAAAKAAFHLLVSQTCSRARCAAGQVGRRTRSETR